MIQKILWEVQTHDETFNARYVVMATGSNSKIWNIVQHLGHTIVPPVPSLFTFNISDDRIADIPGLSTMAEVTVLDKKVAHRKLRSKEVKEAVLFSEGPLLITHWGMSGPAILKLSAWGARLLKEYDYRFKISVNWVPEYHANGLLDLFMEVKEVERKTVLRTKVLEIPKATLEKLGDCCWNQQMPKHGPKSPNSNYNS